MRIETKVPLVYVMLYKSLAAKASPNLLRVDMAVARQALSQQVMGLDSVRIGRVLEEMAAYRLVAEIGREHIQLNKVECPDV